MFFTAPEWQAWVVIVDISAACHCRANETDDLYTHTGLTCSPHTVGDESYDGTTRADLLTVTPNAKPSGVGLMAFCTIQRGQLIASEPCSVIRDDGTRSRLPWTGCPLLHFLTHSCAPNTEIAWNATTERFVLHALRKIKANEELTVSYIDPYQGTEERLEDLGFDCLCPVCVSALNNMILHKPNPSETERKVMGIALATIRDWRTQHFGALPDSQPMVLTRLILDSVVRRRLAQFPKVVQQADFLLNEAERAMLRDSKLGLAHEVLATVELVACCTCNDLAEWDLHARAYDEHRYAQVVKLRECLGPEHPRTVQCEAYAARRVEELLDEIFATAQGGASGFGAGESDGGGEPPAALGFLGVAQGESAPGKHWKKNKRRKDRRKESRRDQMSSDETSSGYDDDSQPGSSNDDIPPGADPARPRLSWRPVNSTIDSQGIGATRDIEACELIMSMPVSLEIPGPSLRDAATFQAFLRTTTDDQKEHLLYYLTRSPPEYWPPITRVPHFVLAIEVEHERLYAYLKPRIPRFAHPFVANAPVYRLCRKMWLLNHSCSPNAHASWNPLTRRLNVRAVKAIAHGDEITVPYVDVIRPFAARARGLDFKCRCVICIAAKNEPDHFADWEASIGDLAKGLMKMRTFRSTYDDEAAKLSPERGRTILAEAEKQKLLDAAKMLEKGNAKAGLICMDFAPCYAVPAFIRRVLYRAEQRQDCYQALVQNLRAEALLLARCLGGSHPSALDAVRAFRVMALLDKSLEQEIRELGLMDD
ncbi:hypothetical protein LTR53_010635 [Teratosphaeriaceae sp. CCFEE 6253]|nr:hypothetical protein LTR53_010635 [Teratosphaeriaceae sp. CCFEE 6253]